ncbi:MAG: signal recognition particle-docking protein FtsY [Nitrospirae bacterium RIFCSPHIGHO2_01_FULL_66_17]|nr:MAG: signal recognition particle-docking protein FtsY [Nitrospirae bacterium RIFCSPHIGHO2_01_FULL_66_17]
MSLWDRFSAGLTRTRQALAKGLDAVRGTLQPGDVAAAFDELESALIGADVGVRLTDRLLSDLRRAGHVDVAELRKRLKSLIASCGDGVPSSALVDGPRPLVVLFVGVNGVGKTTSVAKLAARYQSQGLRVLLAAGDTFRAAAIEQLQVWGDRLGIEVIAQRPGSDPAAVVFDAATAAKARDADVLLIDSAGRLHTKHALMDELIKIKRVIGRAVPGAPHEILLVLDAATGQNGLAQARVFHEALGVTGIVVTKLDGTAKGGIVLAIMEDLRLPVKLLGLGEEVEALVPFDAEAFAEGLVG